MSYDKIIEDMRTSKVRNYIIPGLDSYLLKDGCVRMFHSTRHYAGEVTPHTHRFDFACYVLQGEVENRIYERVTPDLMVMKHDGDNWKKGEPEPDYFTIRTLVRSGTEHDIMGSYDQFGDEENVPFISTVSKYTGGAWYSMTHDQFHSIRFGKDTKVIFFEGPELRPENQVLLPYMHNETIETMECQKPWMYLSDG